MKSVMPRFGDFKALVGEIDPTNKFGNEFTDSLFGL
jgi:xylitol oxidase